MTPRELAARIADHFEPEVGRYGLRTTLSAIDFSKMDELAKATDGIALLLMDIEKFKDEIALSLCNRRKYATTFQINYYVDLYHFIELLMIGEMKVKKSEKQDPLHNERNRDRQCTCRRR